MKLLRNIIPVLALLLNPLLAENLDWPTWRYDKTRSACAPFELPLPLSIKWSKHLGTPRPAWPRSQYKIRFDASFEPVAAGKLIYVPSMVTDSVTAFDTETGNTVWRFLADGPVRFAPLYDDGRLYIVSDDGYLYCLNALTGKLIWQFRGGPDNRKILGNDRLINMWPVRGAPVLDKGIIYFAAGIWPFMGISIHAVNALTGESVWINSGTGSIFIDQPHDSPAFAGIAPQGYCALSEDKLFVSGGRTVPAAFDRKTGELLYYRLGEGKKAGSYAVEIAGPLLVNGGWRVYRHRDGSPLRTYARPYNGFYSHDGIYEVSGFEIIKKRLVPSLFDEVDKDGNPHPACIFETEWLTRDIEPYPDRIYIRTGNQLVGASRDGIISIMRIHEKGVSVEWDGSIPEKPWSFIAADNKLFAITGEGNLYCFSPGQGKPDFPGLPDSVRAAVEKPVPVRSVVDEVVKTVYPEKGYCIVIGEDPLPVVHSVLSSSVLNVIIINSEQKRVDSIREMFLSAGLYGKRVTCFTSDGSDISLPKYMAACIIASDMKSAEQFLRTEFLETLRPYGGAFIIGQNPEIGKIKQLVDKTGIEGLEIHAMLDSAVIRRKGALAGSGNWTHQSADSANSLVSKDARVKAPLGLLWFGGPPNDKILPRHGHGPSPQVVDGILYIEGPDLLRAVDIYTGLVVWEREFPGIGKYYDEIWHQAGANEIGSNYVSLSDGIYLVTPSKCMRLDPKTGKTLNTFLLPKNENGVRPSWGFISVNENKLIAAAFPIAVTPAPEQKTGRWRSKQIKDGTIRKQDVIQNADYGAGSKKLFVMDQYTGQVVWSKTAEFNFRHNSIACGNGKLYCLDSLTEKRLKFLKRRGTEMKGRPGIKCFDLETGKELWKKTVRNPGTWLAYSDEMDILIETGTRGRDRAWDENEVGVRAYAGRDGTMKWRLRQNPGGPVMLHHKILYMQKFGVLMEDGSQLFINHPVTGQSVGFTMRRTYGCNTIIASEYLMTFRSAATGFYNLENHGGTGNLGGFKSGCTSNLIVAGGILNAPDYTRTCTCSYQNQCSVAAVHMPDTETWTFATADFTNLPLKRLGLNLGAPGDRLDEQNTYWYEYPVVGGRSPSLPVEVTGENLTYHRHHSLYMKETENHPWVHASSQEGECRILIQLFPEPESDPAYTVNLYFAETGEKREGERVFSVAIQNKTVLTDFDVVKEAGMVMNGVVKSFSGIKARSGLVIELDKGKAGLPIISGMEIIRE